MATKQILISRAWIAKKLKRYDDMYACIRAVAQSGESLNKRERTMFYLAYQHALRPYRDGWYKLLVITELIDGSRRKMQLTKEYKEYVEKQWTEYCMEVISTIDSILLPRVSRPRPRAFYLKMRADFTRYLIEIAVKKKRLIRETKAAYLEAVELCEEKLSPCHPLRLGVVLNVCVFYAHVQKKRELAIATAKAALAEGEKVLGQVEGKNRLKKVTNLLQLLRDNVAYWAPRGSDEEEINEPILKGESIKEAKMLSRTDYATTTTAAGTGKDPKAGVSGVVKRTPEGKYGAPTLVNEYDADLAEEANAATQVILIESFKSPPPSEEMSDDSEEERQKRVKAKAKAKAKGQKVRVKGDEEDADVDDEDEDEETSEEETEEEEEEEERYGEWEGEDWEWEGEGYEGRGRRKQRSPPKPRKVPPDGIIPYVFSPSEDDFLYKKVLQEEEYLAELVANTEAAQKRNEEIMAMKLAPKSTESQLDTETVASKSTTVLGERLSDDVSGSSSSGSGEEGGDDQFPDQGDQEAEDRLVEQILDDFFKADLAKMDLDLEGGGDGWDETCVSSRASLTSAAAAAGGVAAASSVSFGTETSYSGTTIPSKSTFLGELKKKRRRRARPGEGIDEEEEGEGEEEEEEGEQEELEGEGAEGQDEAPGEGDELEPEDQGSDQGSYDSDITSDDFDDLKDDESKASIRMEGEELAGEEIGEAEGEAETEAEAEESEEEEEEMPGGGGDGEEEGDADIESVAGSKATGRKHKDKGKDKKAHAHRTRTRSRAGSLGSGGSEEGEGSSSEESSGSTLSPRSSRSSGSASSSASSTTSQGATGTRKKTQNDGFHPLPPGPRSAFDQRGYVDEFSKVVRDVETGMDSFEFSKERFQEIDRILEYLEDQEERREVAESEERHFDPVSGLNVEDPLVKLMFTEFRIVYPEYDHDVTAGVSIGDEDLDSDDESSQDEASAAKGQSQPRSSSLPGTTQDDIVAKNEAEDKAEIQCLLQYPEDFREYEEQSFKAEYVKIERPEPASAASLRHGRGYGYGYEYGGEGGEEELGEMDMDMDIGGGGLDGEAFHTIMKPRSTDTDASGLRGHPGRPPPVVKSSKSVRLSLKLKETGSKPKTKIPGPAGSTAKATRPPK